jgi:hypothetical protein
LKIKAKFNIDDDEFIKTLNIIDHWITLPSEQKSLQTTILKNILEDPKFAEKEEKEDSDDVSNMLGGELNDELEPKESF